MTRRTAGRWLLDVAVVRVGTPPDVQHFEARLVRLGGRGGKVRAVLAARVDRCPFKALADLCESLPHIASLAHLSRRPVVK